VTAQPDEALVGNWDGTRVRFRPVSLASVRLGGLLGRTVRRSNDTGIAAALDSDICRGFHMRSMGQKTEWLRLSADSDQFKWLEGACYALAAGGAPSTLAGEVERVVDLTISPDAPNGYIASRVRDGRLLGRCGWHDLYVAGHMMEAGVAHHGATGSRRLLDAACALADRLMTAHERGNPYFEGYAKHGHQEIEVALVRLARAGWRREYIGFARALAGLAHVGGSVSDLRVGPGRRHAVRVLYLLSAMTELYMETGEDELLEKAKGLWEEITRTRMYVTGGLGRGERIPETPHDLPQWLPDETEFDIAETCASVALCQLGWRLHAVTGDPRCFDVVETALYNNVLGALSEDCTAVRYFNPLRVVGSLEGYTDWGGPIGGRMRLPKIHPVSCCFPNVWRLLGQIPEYVFSLGRDEVAVNLYTAAKAVARLDGGARVTIDVETDYPHSGRVLLRVSTESPAAFALLLRIPDWCADAEITVEGTTSPATAGTYHRIDRKWRDSAEVALQMPMAPRVIRFDERIEANRGQVAIARGPLVYCLEQADASGLDLARLSVALPGGGSQGVAEEFRPDLFGGVWTLTVMGREHSGAAEPGGPYAAVLEHPVEKEAEVTLIPYYCRANRSDDSRWLTLLPCEGV